MKNKLLKILVFLLIPSFCVKAQIDENTSSKYNNWSINNGTNYAKEYYENGSALTNKYSETNSTYSNFTNLQFQIISETNRAYNAETNLQGQIVVETNRAYMVETNLQAQINIETNRAYTVETNLQAQIISETNRAYVAETNNLAIQQLTNSAFDTRISENTTGKVDRAGDIITGILTLNTNLNVFGNLIVTNSITAYGNIKSQTGYILGWSGEAYLYMPNNGPTIIKTADSKGFQILGGPLAAKIPSFTIDTTGKNTTISNNLFVAFTNQAGYFIATNSISLNGVVITNWNNITSNIVYDGVTATFTEGISNDFHVTDNTNLSITFKTNSSFDITTLTNFVTKNGDIMTGPLTNNMGFYGDGKGITNLSTSSLTNLSEYLKSTGGDITGPMNWNVIYGDDDNGIYITNNNVWTKNKVYIGHDEWAVSSSNRSIGIIPLTAVGFNSVTLGGHASEYGVAVGYGADGRNTGTAFGAASVGQHQGVSIGYQAKGSYSGVAIGCSDEINSIYVYGNYGSVAVGFGSQASLNDGFANGYGVAIGYFSYGVNKGVAIGANSWSTSNSVAIGFGVTNTIENTTRIKGNLDMNNSVITNALSIWLPTNGIVYFGTATNYIKDLNGTNFMFMAGTNWAIMGW